MDITQIKALVNKNKMVCWENKQYQIKYKHPSKPKNSWLIVRHSTFDSILLTKQPDAEIGGGETNYFIQTDMRDQLIEELKNGIFNKDTFDWENHSDLIPQHAPQFFDKELYNWTYFSEHVIEFLPDAFDENLYAWEFATNTILEHKPEWLGEKANLKKIINKYPQYIGMGIKDIKKQLLKNKI